MAYTYSVWESDGVRTTYPFDLPLGYLDQNDVYVYAGEDTEFDQELSYRWIDSVNIELIVVPPAGTIFKIRRIVNRNTLDYTFARQSIKGEAIDNQHKQLLMISQEIMDGFAEDPLEGGADMRDKVGDRPDGTPLVPNEVWLADTQIVGALTRKRPLPLPETNVPVGRRITIRDDTGNASTVPIIIEHAGNTIMGELVDLAITRDWAWVELVCDNSAGHWRVEKGGVGSALMPDRRLVADMAWPVGVLLLSHSSLNPSVYLGIGKWEQVSRGRAIVGEGEAADDEGNIIQMYPLTKVGLVQTLLSEQNIPEMSITVPEPNEVLVARGDMPTKGGNYTEHTYSVGVHDPAPFSNVQPSEVCYVWKRVA